MLEITDIITKKELEALAKEVNNLESCHDIEDPLDRKIDELVAQGRIDWIEYYNDPYVCREYWDTLEVVWNGYGIHEDKEWKKFYDAMTQKIDVGLLRSIMRQEIERNI